MEQLGVLQGEFDDLSKFPDLVTKSTNSRKADLPGVFERHVINERVDFPGEHAHNGQGGHVERDTGSLLELSLVDLGPAADDISRSGRSLDNDY